MGPKKSASDCSTDNGYPSFLQKICQEEDVFIVPQFVTIYTGRHVSSRRPKDFKMDERLDGESKGEDLTLCGNVHPPQVGIIYSNPDDKETPIAIVCKNLYVEYSLVSAFGKSLKPYPTISTLKIENCCISKEITEALAFLLADEPGQRIADLSLDGNEGISQMLPLFVKLPTGVKYLSLQRCSLEDKDVAMFAEALGYSDEKDHKLQVLNLGMNKIGNAGMAHLAKVLRTNRTLVSLSLMGNRIEDEGASCLCDVLQKFQLMQEEVEVKRKRTFDQISVKRAAVERYLEEMKAKGDASNTNLKKEDRLTTAGRKIRGQDGKIRCTSIREVKIKSRMNSGEKFRRKKLRDYKPDPESNSSEILAIAQQVESETPPDKHPFVNEVIPLEDNFWCLGCWSLSNLNLSFNYLTEETAKNFTGAVNFQRENFKPQKTGLVRLVLLPGNWISENSDHFQNLQVALAQKSSKKDVSQDASESLAAGSITSTWKMSSSGRKMKNS